MKTLKTLFAIATIALLFAACSEDEDGNGNSVADSYVGIWQAQDTLEFSGFITYNSYNFSIAKRDDNSVFFINFYDEDTTIFTVTETSLAYVSGASCDYFFTTLVAVKSGNKITYTSEDCDGYDVRGAATKQ